MLGHVLGLLYKVSFLGCILKTGVLKVLDGFVKKGFRLFETC